MALELALAAAAPVAAVIIPPAASAEAAAAAAAPVAAPAIEATAMAADAPCKSIVVGYIYCYVALVRRRCSRESAYYYLVRRPPPSFWAGSRAKVPAFGRKHSLSGTTRS